jgi:hypothetical protein
MEEAQGFPEIKLPCKHLRNKEMYYQNDGQEDDQYASGLFWCTKTHENFGPDGESAGKNECCSSRSCYIN